MISSLSEYLPHQAKLERDMPFSLLSVRYTNGVLLITEEGNFVWKFQLRNRMSGLAGFTLFSGSVSGFIIYWKMYKDNNKITENSDKEEPTNQQ